MSIPSTFIDRLLSSINIVDVIGRRLTLERKGGAYWAKCPFHGSGEERTASFKVYEETGTYHCFGCNAHGDAFKFLMDIENIDLEKAKYLCSLPKILGTHPDIGKEITVNVGRFGPYLKCENKSARIESIDELFSIGLNRAITLISEAKPGRMSSSMIKDLGEHPEDKKPVRVMKGQYGPYIKYKSLNATIPEEKDPTELTMEEALILIEKRKEYDKTKKSKKRKSK